MQPECWRSSRPRSAMTTCRESVREHCKDLLLDALACALSGDRGEETHQLAALAGALAQSNEASVIGGGRLSLAGATLLNGYLITATTMCDVHRATMTHVTPEVVPPALAIAEGDGNSGRDLLVAIAAGCEVTTRIGVGIDYPEFRKRGWHGPGVFGPFGAAAAVGRLRGFDADTMARAFGLAGSQAAGTFAAWGTPTVKFHQCRGALSGLMAALAGGAAIRGDARIPHRQGRRPVQHLRRRRPARSRHRRSRQALGARADRAAAVAVGVADAGHEHRTVRHSCEARHRSGGDQDRARDTAHHGLRHARQAAASTKPSSKR